MENIKTVITGGSEKQNAYATSIANKWIARVLSEAQSINDRLSAGNETDQNFIAKLKTYHLELINNAKVLADVILPKAGAKTIIEQNGSSILVTRAIQGAKNKAGF